MIYCFICLDCKQTRSVSRPMADHALPETCECGHKMERNFVAEHSSVRGDYKKPIVSESLAFDACDLTEHRRRHPDIDVVVEGRCARPVLRSLTQKKRYVKARGFVDTNSFS